MLDDSQAWLMQPLELLGYPVQKGGGLDRGVCLGFEMMAAQAMATGTFDVFEQRVNFIKSQTPEQLVNQINESKSDAFYADIRDFFDSLYVAQQSQKYGILEGEVSNSGMKPGFPTMAPEAADVNNATIEIVDNFIGCYDNNELLDYMRSIQDAAVKSDSSQPFVLGLGACNHAILLTYRPNENEHPWVVVDANDDEQKKNIRYFNSAEEASAAVSAAFTLQAADAKERVMLSYVIARDDKKDIALSQIAHLKNDPEWKKIHALNDHKVFFRPKERTSLFFAEILYGVNDKNASELLDGYLKFLKNEHADVANTLRSIRYQNDIAGARQDIDLLSLAVCSHHYEFATKLLNHGVALDEKQSNIPLFSAVEAPDGCEMVKLLIEHGANVNAADEEGNTPLMEAAKNGNKEMVALLIDKGADIQAKNREEKIALDLTANDTIIDLLNKAVKVDTTRDFTNEEENANYSVDRFLEVYPDLIKKIYERYNEMVSISPDDVAAFNQAKKEFDNAVTICSNYMENCLDFHKAAGDTNEFLWELSAVDESTPLMIYFATGHQDVADAVNYVNPNELFNMQEEDLEVYPIHFAVMCNNEKAIDSLYDLSIDVNQESNFLKTRDGAKATPLSIAVSNNHTNVLKTLVDKGAKVTSENVASCQSSDAKKLVGSKFEKQNEKNDLHMSVSLGR